MRVLAMRRTLRRIASAETPPERYRPIGCGLQADSSGDGKSLKRRHARIEMTTNSDNPDASASAGPASGDA